MSVPLPPSPPTPRAAGKASVVAVIVNYRTPDLVIDCLASLETARADCPGLAVAVADNASGDGSARQIAEVIGRNGWGEWVRLMEMPENGGFAYGNNAIIRDHIGRNPAPDYFWLLNSDTVVRPGALPALLDFMERHPQAGMAGSRLEFPDGSPQHSAFAFHSIAGEFEGSVHTGLVTKLLGRWKVAPDISSAERQYDWLSGASMLIRTDVLKQTGLFDEGYFLYYEETDFCLRARRQGWQCWYVPSSRVVHLVGKSTSVTGQSNLTRRRAPYWFESRRRYFVKHYGRFYATLADLSLAAGTLLWMARTGLERRPSSCPDKFLHDLVRHSAAFHRLSRESR